MLPLAIILLLLITVHSQNTTVIPVNNLNNITIAFGSCLNTFEEDADIQQGLQAIIRTQPDLWMWIGDAVYLDGDTFFTGSLPGPGYDINDGAFVQNIFNTLKTNPNYVQLRESTPIIGTWDDHDYAYNNANETFEFKERNKGFYLDFLDEPVNSSRRNQQGVYTSYYIGDEKLIKIILLDVRYNRDAQSTANSLLETDTTSTFDDMLGDEQWAWLDAQLQDPNGTYTLISSGTQYLPNNRPVVGDWFENSRERLLDLIKNHQKSGTILLSGDVHFAEMIKYPCPARVGYKNLYEFTSSGITHSSSYVDVFDGVVDGTYSTEADRYFGKNFALLKFVRPENSTTPPNLLFEAKDVEGNTVLSREVPYSDLIFDAALAASYSGCDAVESIGDVLNEGTNDVQDAVNDATNDVQDAVNDTTNAVEDIFSKKKQI